MKGADSHPIVMLVPPLGILFPLHYTLYIALQYQVHLLKNEIPSIFVLLARIA